MKTSELIEEARVYADYYGHDSEGGITIPFPRDKLLELADRLEQYEKALDRACYELSMYEEAITFDNLYHDKDIWKEWCLGK